MVALARALQRCTMQSGTPLGRLGGAIKDLHQCLTYLIKMDDLLSISMLDVAEEKPLTSLKPTEKTGQPDKPEPWEEESSMACPPYRPEALGPEGTGSSGGLAIV